MANWKAGLTFLEPKYVEHKVGDQTLKFYPMSIGLAFKLKIIGKPLSKAFTVLTADDKQDIATKARTLGNTDGTQDQEISTEPITAELAAFRGKQRQQAIEDLFEGLTSEASIDAIGEILIDALRDKIPADNKPSGREFINEVPLPTVTALLVGVAKANKGVFGPLAGKVEGAMGAIADRLGARMPKPDPSSTNGSPSKTSLQTPPPQDGPSSISSDSTSNPSAPSTRASSETEPSKS